MLKVGLTGSIAVGKSYVLAFLGRLGCLTLDADPLAHDLLRPDSPAYHEIVDEFGDTICDDRGFIDRRRLASIVFADRTKRARLNAIVHPYIAGAIQQWLADAAKSHPKGIAVVDAALIIEAGRRDDFDRLIVVFCRAQDQIARLMARDGMTREEVGRRLSAQLSSDEKRKHADFEIDTSGSFADTASQVRTVFEKLKAIQEE